MAAIGRPLYINIKTADSLQNPDKSALQAHALHLLDTAYQLGIRHFDSAPGYGIAEEILLDWTKKRNYSDIGISTKWGYIYTANFEKNPEQHEVKEHSLPVLQQQWKYSRQLFPYLNMYQIHSATLDSGVLENKEVLKELAAIKNLFHIQIGLTTSGVQQNEVIKKALAVSVDGKPLFSVFQVTYNLFEQSIAEVIDLLHAANATIIIKESLANGRILRSQMNDTILERLAEKYKVGKDAVAIRFCMDTLKPDFVLSGAATGKQLEQNLLASTFTLHAAEIDQLKKMRVNSEAYWNERKQLAWN